MRRARFAITREFLIEALKMPPDTTLLAIECPLFGGDMVFYIESPDLPMQGPGTISPLIHPTVTEERDAEGRVAGMQWNWHEEEIGGVVAGDVVYPNMPTFKEA